MGILKAYKFECHFASFPTISTNIYFMFNLKYNYTQKSFDQVTYFVKVHAKWEALLEGAERLNLRMPVEVSPVL